MERRRFITAAGIAGTAALAGCVANDDNGDNGTGASTPPEERIDSPPHSPERPPGEEDEWDRHYLGEGMETDPSLSFEAVDVRLADPRLGAPSATEDEYAARLVTSRDDLEAQVDIDASGDRLANVDFDEEAVVIVESGYGSGSLHHEWTRVEDTEDGLYLHGYYVTPFVRTDDLTARRSALVVETSPGAEALAHVSLTVDVDRRVNFDSSEGIVTVGEDSDSSDLADDGAPRVSFDHRYNTPDADEDPGTLQLMVVAGETFTAERVRFEGTNIGDSGGNAWHEATAHPGGDTPEPDSTIRAGDRAQLGSGTLDDGDTVQEEFELDIVWSSEDGGSSTIIGSPDGPDA